ncbi:hypothetical protein [Nonomuraea fuscirosea]
MLDDNDESVPGIDIELVRLLTGAQLVSAVTTLPLAPQVSAHGDKPARR